MFHKFLGTKVAISSELFCSGILLTRFPHHLQSVCSLQLRSASSTVPLHDKKMELSLSVSLNRGPQEVKKSYVDKLTVWVIQSKSLYRREAEAAGLWEVGQPTAASSRKPSSCDSRVAVLSAETAPASLSATGFCLGRCSVKNGVGQCGKSLMPPCQPPYALPSQRRRAVIAACPVPARPQWLAAGKCRLCDYPQRKVSFRLISFTLVISFKSIQTQKMPSGRTLKHSTSSKSPPHTPSRWVSGPTRAESRSRTLSRWVSGPHVHSLR